MPSIYRVISLSLVMSLFFAAPLLCVVPISSQIQGGERLAVKNNQPTTVNVVWKRGYYAPQWKARTAAWARTVQSRKARPELPFAEEKWTTTPVVTAGEGGDSWDDGHHQDWDSADVTEGIGDFSTGSRSSIYY